MRSGEIALYFMDESGFCLIPCVPYGWQPIGQYLELLSCRSKRLNILGFLRRNLELEAYISEQTINSYTIIHCMPAFLFRGGNPSGHCHGSGLDSY